MKKILLLCFTTLSSAQAMVPDEVSMLYALSEEVKELRGRIEVLEHRLRKQEVEHIATKHTDASAPLAAKSNFLKKSDVELKKSAAENETANLSPAELLQKAQGYIKEENFSKAMSILKSKAIESEDQEMKMHTAYWIGELSLQKKQYAQAIQSFGAAAGLVLQLLKQNKSVVKGPEIFWKLAYSFTKDDKRNEALVTLNKAEEAFPHMPENIKQKFDTLKSKLTV